MLYAVGVINHNNAKKSSAHEMPRRRQQCRLCFENPKNVSRPCIFTFRFTIVIYWKILFAVSLLNLNFRKRK